jgi:hypothetical protein
MGIGPDYRTARPPTHPCAVRRRAFTIKTACEYCREACDAEYLLKKR